MRLIMLIGFVGLMIGIGHSQPFTYMNATIELGGSDIGKSIITIQNGCLIGGARYYSQNSDYFILRLNEQLDTLWTTKHSLPGRWQVESSLYKINDSLFLGLMNTQSSYQDAQMTYIVVDSAGKIKYSKADSTTNIWHLGIKAIVEGYSGFIIAGNTGSTKWNNPLKFYLGWYDSSYNRIKMYVYGDSTYFHTLYDATRTTDGGYLLCGTRDDGNDKDIYIVKTDSLGNMEWDKVYGGAYDDFALTCTQTGTQYIIGGARYINYSNYNAYLMKLDSLGNKIWDKDYDFYIFYTASEIVDIKGFKDNTMVFLENGQKPNSNDFPHLKKVSRDGDIIWSRTYHYNPTYNEYLWDIAQTNDNGFIMVGQAIGPQGQDVWIVKTDSLGCLVAGCDTATGTAVQIMPAPGNELQAWPNPAKDVLYVAHNGYTGREVNYRLISLSGQVVQSGTAILPKGISLQSIQGGMYILQLTTPAGTLIGTSKVAISR